MWVEGGGGENLWKLGAVLPGQTDKTDVRFKISIEKYNGKNIFFRHVITGVIPYVKYSDDVKTSIYTCLCLLVSVGNISGKL